MSCKEQAFYRTLIQVTKAVNRSLDPAKALAAVAGTSALVEPVGLRWEVPAAPAEPKPRQYLMLRNYYLQP